MLRSLIHHRRAHLAVAAGAAVATAVLAGALLVGESVRGSLRRLTLERLGRIEHALLAEGFFSADLAARLDRKAGGVGRDAVPIVLLQGAAVAPDSGARAARVAVHGVDARFAALFSPPPELGLEAPAGGLFPPVAINDALRRELDLELGDSLLLSFERPTDIPRQSLLGERDPADQLTVLRLTLAAVLPDRGAGRFSLAAHQSLPYNAFVPLIELQRRLDQPGRVNALLLPRADGDGGTAAEREASVRGAVRRAVRLDDLGLELRAGERHLALESRRLILRPPVADAVLAWAEAGGRAAQPLLTYLANTMRVGDRVLPYSTVAALRTAEPPLAGALLGASGERAPPPGPEGILLNRWAAEDLQAAPGDAVEMTYYAVGPGDRLETASTRLRVAGIVSLEGLGADPELTPDVPGVADAESMGAWDPPFPVDLDLIRPRDEDYWRRYRGAPKAFVDLETGRRLWRSRFGDVTSIRLARLPDEAPAAAAAELEEKLTATLPLESLGLRVLAARADGLAAAAGSTDFSGLFIGFSLFLIVASLLLVALLFGLAVERRAAEVGIRMAVGFPAARVRRRLLAEGGLVAAAGALAGALLAVLYARAVLTGLRSWWAPLVPPEALSFEPRGTALAAGTVLSVGLVLATVGWTLRGLRRLPVPALLAGSSRQERAGRRGRVAPAVAWIGLAAAIGLLAAALLAGHESSPALFFGLGSSLAASGIAFFALWCRSTEGAGLPVGPLALAALAVRNSARNPGRSLLCVALVGCACFVLVSVGANRRHAGTEPLGRESGTGGFALAAETDVPLTRGLGSREDLLEHGFTAREADLIESLGIVSLRLRPGEDASCLNLYQPTRPRLLGVPPELVERGGFRFRGAGTENPWRRLEEELGQGVIAAAGDYNSVRWILHLGLGDELTIQDDAGEPVRLRIVALLESSIFQSELLVSEAAFQRHFPESGGYAYFLAEPGARVDEAARLLEERLARFGFDATPTAELLARFHEVENIYLTTFQALGGLGLLLGTVGLGVILIRNVAERRAELATLRAFGYRRRLLSGLVVAENTFLLVVGVSIGALSGFTAAAPHLLAGGEAVPWGSLLSTLALVVAVGVAASAVAVAFTARAPLTAALRAD